MSSLLYNDVQRVFFKFCFVFIEGQQNTERKKDFSENEHILHMMATDRWHKDEEQNLHIQ